MQAKLLYGPESQVCPFLDEDERGGHERGLTPREPARCRRDEKSLVLPGVGG